jgi:hypothetical protein
MKTTVISEPYTGIDSGPMLSKPSGLSQAATFLTCVLIWAGIQAALNKLHHCLDIQAGGVSAIDCQFLPVTSLSCKTGVGHLTSVVKPGSPFVCFGAILTFIVHNKTINSSFLLPLSTNPIPNQYFLLSSDDKEL